MTEITASSCDCICTCICGCGCGLPVFPRTKKSSMFEDVAATAAVEEDSGNDSPTYPGKGCCKSSIERGEGLPSSVEESEEREGPAAAAAAAVEGGGSDGGWERGGGVVIGPLTLNELTNSEKSLVLLTLFARFLGPTKPAPCWVRSMSSSSPLLCSRTADVAVKCSMSNASETADGRLGSCGRSTEDSDGCRWRSSIAARSPIRRAWLGAERWPSGPYDVLSIDAARSVHVIVTVRATLTVRRQGR